MALVNYRGSRGYGQNFLSSLPGKCGRQDVDDVMQSLEDVKKVIEVDSSKVSIFGGSHGGFLTTHLIGKFHICIQPPWVVRSSFWRKPTQPQPCVVLVVHMFIALCAYSVHQPYFFFPLFLRFPGQFPDTFWAAATRNPVTNVAHMASSTDIPDWCYVECGIPYEVDRLPTSEDYSIMFNASPIAHAGNVKTPLLMMVGDADRRVPMTQGIDYYKLLKARGVNTRLLVYPENRHSLANTLAAESDSWVNSALWMAGRFF